MSNLTLRNNTAVPVEFVIAIGDHVLGRPCVEPGGEAALPGDVYQVTAETQLQGNGYVSAPVDVSPGTALLAETLETFGEGAYEFTLSVFGAPPGELVFQKSAVGPVTFTIMKSGRLLQSVIVTDALLPKTLNVGVDTYAAVALAKGVVVASAVTTDPNATITLLESSVNGEYALVTQ